MSRMDHRILGEEHGLFANDVIESKQIGRSGSFEGGHWTKPQRWLKQVTCLPGNAGTFFFFLLGLVFFAPCPIFERTSECGCKPQKPL